MFAISVFNLLKNQEQQNTQNETFYIRIMASGRRAVCSFYLWLTMTARILCGLGRSLFESGHLKKKRCKWFVCILDAEHFIINTQSACAHLSI